MNIRLFGITREIVGEGQLEIPAPEALGTVGELKTWLFAKYPEMKGLDSLAVAVDHEYAEDHAPIYSGQEVAVIPPVSGG